MDKAIHWLSLWKELSEAQQRFWDNAGPKKKAKTESAADNDSWKEKADHFDALVRKRWEQPDSTRDFILSALRSRPGATVLDIGAGTGAWALLMARHAGRVTALEPSPAMRAVLARNAQSQGLDNIDIVDGSWPAAVIDPHDFSLASHSFYGCPDFASIIRRMNQVTRDTCMLLLRLSLSDALMARAATLVWGQPHDSPNFQVAFNALLDMGIYPNVLIETPNHWEPWSHESFEAALAELLARFNLTAQSPHAPALEQMLKQELTQRDGRWIWPNGIQSALVYWKADAYRD